MYNIWFNSPIRTSLSNSDGREWSRDPRSLNDFVKQIKARFNEILLPNEWKNEQNQEPNYSIFEPKQKMVSLTFHSIIFNILHLTRIRGNTVSFRRPIIYLKFRKVLSRDVIPVKSRLPGATEVWRGGATASFALTRGIQFIRVNSSIVVFRFVPW